jgi:peptidoglycan/LPS O-acetylase OafA/YrhL
MLARWQGLIRRMFFNAMDSGMLAPSRTVPAYNNFDLLRFCLAMVVCLVHASILSAQPALAVIQDGLSSEIAVQGFFAVSGFLIFMSYERSSSMKSYIEKRVRRLVPAYVTVIVLSAVLLRAFSSAEDFFFTRDWWAYLAANLSYLNFLHPELPGLFQNNTVHAVNGALWTLKVEIAFYMTVPVFVWLIGRVGAAPVLVGTYVLSSFYASHVGGSLQHQLPGELRYFMAGAACYYGWPYLQNRWPLVAAVTLALFLAGKFLPIGFIMPATIGVLVICAAFGRYLGNFGKYGDFSYGVYILHFPIIQTLTQAGVFERSPWVGLALATALTLAGAVLLWRLVESRFLHRRSGHPEMASGQPISG